MGNRIEEEAAPGGLCIVSNCDERPEIRVTLECSDVADEAAEHLGLDGEIYQRGGALVHVVTPSATSPGARPAPVIRELPLPILRVRLQQVARWVKFAPRDREWKRIDVPEKIVSAVYSRGTWEYVRPLAGVISAPTMRRDGSILQTSGYDRQSELLLWPTADFVEVPDSPTLEDAQGAAAAILDVVCDFPFATDCDRSAWLAAFLTLLARFSIDGPCPLFQIDSNTRGSGKSRLVDVASVAAHGVAAARSSISAQDEEMRKQITSLLAEGALTALFDNVRSGGKVGGPALDGLLTSAVWKDRLLGKTQNLTLPALTVWWLTGNNVQLTGDLPRRTLRIRLESPLENPEARDSFKHGEGDELLRHVERSRKFLVTQGLIILRAHFVAGRPRCDAHWGSFEAWCRIVASAIRWVGLPDPLACRATEDEANDEERMCISATIAVMLAIGRPLTARELVAELYPRTQYEGEPYNDPSETYAPARDSLEAATAAKGHPDVHHVGQFLKRAHGRVVDGRAIVGEVDRKLKIKRWTVKGPTA